jgi:hypothetical protein
MKKRSSYMRYNAFVELKRTPLFVSGYNKAGNFVCRIGMSSAGLAVYAGTTGNKLLADVTWETLVKRLHPKQ